MTINQAKERHEAALMQLPNVLGVGLGNKEGQEVIVILVTKKVPSSLLLPQEAIPSFIEGYATDVIAIGKPTINS